MGNDKGFGHLQDEFVHLGKGTKCPDEKIATRQSSKHQKPTQDSGHESKHSAPSASSAITTHTIHRDFHSFHLLLPEVRVSIWELARFIPRKVDIRIDPHFPDHPLGDKGCRDSMFRFILLTPRPAVLYVNQESRKEALRWYSRDFRYKKGLEEKYETEPKIYVNWEVERICVLDVGKLVSNWEAATHFADAMTEKRARFMALKYSYLATVHQIFQSGLSLQELILCHQCSSHGYRDTELNPARIEIEFVQLRVGHKQVRLFRLDPMRRSIMIHWRNKIRYALKQRSIDVREIQKEHWGLCDQAKQALDEEVRTWKAGTEPSVKQDVLDMPHRITKLLAEDGRQRERCPSHPQA